MGETMSTGGDPVGEAAGWLLQGRITGPGRTAVGLLRNHPGIQAMVDVDPDMRMPALPRLRLEDLRSHAWLTVPEGTVLADGAIAGLEAVDSTNTASDEALKAQKPAAVLLRGPGGRAILPLPTEGVGLQEALLGLMGPAADGPTAVMAARAFREGLYGFAERWCRTRGVKAETYGWNEGKEAER